MGADGWERVGPQGRLGYQGTWDAAAGDSSTLAWVLVVFVVAVVLVIPSIALLFALDQRSRLEEEM